MNYLLGITIGPVQSFIEESKKLKDLYNSSKIIVEIMKKLYSKLKSYGCIQELIYPQCNYEQDIFTNYLIVQVDNNSMDISSLLDDVYNDLSKHKNLIEDLKGNFNCFWAYEEINCNKDENNEYKKAYNNLTRFISNLKNTYEFENSIQEAGGKKCMLCGKRNAYKKYQDDELCLLCCFKREYSKTNFPSVYDIAAESILRKCDKFESNKFINNNKKYCRYSMVCNIIEKLKKIEELLSLKDEVSVEDVLKELKKNDKEYSYEINMFEELMDDIKKIYQDYLNVKFKEDLIKDLEELKEMLEKIYKSDSDIKPPALEYAFIKLDVDNLGKWMSGKFINDDIDLKEFQKELSSYLFEFSKVLKEKIDNECTVIYAGGDDFLAICSCEKIFRIVHYIENIFKKEVSDKVCKYTFRNIHYSMSITIAQCKDTMNYALRKNRVELENVKSKFESEKNAVAITYIVNSGKEICCYIKKKDIEQLEKVLKSYKALENNMSLSYTRTFSKEFKNICDNNSITRDQCDHIGDICLLELKRIMNRSSKVDDELTNNYIEDVCMLFERLYKRCIKLKTNDYLIDINNIIDLFELINHLSNDKYYETRE